MRDIRGTGVAMVTPFRSNGGVDFEGLKRLCDHLIDGGVDYLVVQGTTGEAATLDHSEKQEVLDAVVGFNDGRLPLVFGHGGNNTSAMIEAFNTLNLDGVDAILTASPYYNKPTQPGIVAHYKALADASPMPVILYNVPGRTSSNLLPATTLELAGHSNIIAVKEASGDLDQVGEIIHGKPDGFLVLSGDDPLIIPHMAIGGNGIISVIANAFPAEFSSIARCCERGDYDEARKFHYLLIDLVHLIFAEGNPGGIKEALSVLGIIENHVRLPLVPVSKDLSVRIEAAIKAIKSAGGV